MEQKSFRIILAEQKSIGGIVRNPGYVLLEGVCPQMLTADEIGEHIRLGQVKVEVVKSKEEGGEAPV
ncbi:MAG: hypothetical protein A2Y00_05485 [Omnitrophica WOR_2 bacterium GWF2_43_52]|nr:MAG: hypothetical protein A2Y01_07355 [Omnitrophica WOR_2 bacterium GWC2_44_8]OGX20552.1 MAG: hypothetical protein A2Y00_05485 [Omnitrophica WOR_2 bacterium GWF2_43_52]HAH21632.1 hypothetical protein [Candidatus Omnitrophota bacterium]HBG64225.1 hypothetical protein [Candidatus Omnitrophota bacterium]